MQVQSIQTTSNCRKPCFKAYFINDAKGKFRDICKHAEQTQELKDQIAELASNHKQHKLEIDYYVDYYYRIFNHYTMKYKVIEFPENQRNSGILYSILKRINEDKSFFEDDSFSKSYRLLTGQEEE